MRKKFLFAFFALFAVGVCTFGMTACFESSPEETGGKEIHQHTYEKTVIAPTCEETGYTLYVCSCGDKYIDNKTEALGHSFVYYTSDNNATCTKDGTKTAKCERCDKTDTLTDKGSAHGHTEVIDKAVEATCTQTGLTEGKHCSECGTVIVAQTTITAGHTEVIDKAVEATCTQTGLTEGKHCSECGEVIVSQKVIPAKGHTEVTDEAVEATCTQTGLTEGKHCSDCGEVIIAQTVIPAKGHTEVTDEAVEATCTQTGLTEGKHCSVCGEVIIAQTLIPAKGHTEVIDEAVEANCTQTGLTEGKHCSVCGEVIVEQELISKTHSYIDGVCTICGALQPTEGINYVLSGNEYYVAGIGSATDSNIVIASEYNGLPVTSIASSAFKGCTKITSITVPDSVTNIGSSAFSGCYNLVSMTLPSLGYNFSYYGVTCKATLGYLFGTASYSYSTETLQYYQSGSNNYTSNKYYIPTALRSVTITGGEVPYGSFYGCSKLTEIILAEGVTSIGEKAFYSCTYLQTLVVASTVTKIGNNVFYGCSNLVNISLPVIALSHLSSSNLKQLKTAEITGGTNVNDNIFSESTLLESLVISDAVTYINSNLFDNCTSLAEIIVDEDNERYFSLDGILYDKTTNEIVCVPQAISGEITIPDGVSEIGSSLFKNRKITDVTLPDSLEVIGNSAFYGCQYLKTINFPDNLTKIDSYAFVNCSMLGNFSLPEGLKEIGLYAFQSCQHLTEVVIPYSVNILGDYAFSGCSYLESLTLPYILKPIGYLFGTELYVNSVSVEQKYYQSATTTPLTKYFYLPASLNSVTVLRGNIPYGAFYNCSKFTNLTLPSNMTEMGEYALYNCSALEYISAPTVALSNIKQYAKNVKTLIISGGTSIANNELQGCSSVTSITLAESITTIGRYAFAYCTALENLIIPDGVTTINDFSFQNCSSLESITIPQSVTYVGISILYDCNSLKNIYYEGNLTSLFGLDTSYIMGPGRTLYINGEELSGEIQIPNGITKVPGKVFYGCDKITGIILPDSVTSIGSFAFAYCSGLTKITIPDKVMTIESSAFSNCNNLESITIPQSLTSIGNYAFDNCSELTDIYYKGDIASWCGITNVKNIMTDGRTLYIGGQQLTGEIVIPVGVTSIPAYAFYGCNKITSIIINDNVTSIGENAFTGCVGLESITLPFVGAENGGTTNTYFGYIFGAISYTQNSTKVPQSLKTVTITGGDSIAANAFYGCKYITSLSISDSVTTVGDNAFKNCSGLVNVIIGKGVTSLPEGVLSGCGSLESITIPFVGESKKTLDDYYQYPFGYIFGTTSYDGGRETSQCYYADSLEDTVSQTYYLPTNLKSITITGGAIVNFAFSFCYYITEIIIGDDVTAIGDFAFNYCSALTDVTIGNGVTSMGKSAFNSCSLLKSVIIPDSVTTVGISAFAYCSELTKVIIGNKLESLSNSMFASCTNLTDVVIGKEVQTINNNAFYGCSSLTNIYFATSIEGTTPTVSSTGNTSYLSANTYLYSEDDPGVSGEYWHYVDGEIVVWMLSED